MDSKTNQPLAVAETGSREVPVAENRRTFPRERWLRFIAPSVADLFFIAILFSLSCGRAGVRLLNDAGIGWHIRNGEQILQTRHITRVDLFSSTMAGHAWYAWEWLYDVIIAAVHHFTGLNGVVFFTAIVIAATFSLTLRVALRRGAGLPLMIALLVLSIGAASIHFLARPHVLSWLFAVVWFHLVDSDAAAPSPRELHRLFWYPFLMLLWANLHGGFLLGLVLLAIYLIGGLIQFFSRRKTHEKEDRSLIHVKLKRFALAVLASFAASLINPFGLKLYSHIYEYLTNRFLMDHIDEFLSPNFHNIAPQCFAALLLITLIALAGAREKLIPARLLVVIFAAYSGLYSSRNLPVSSILLVLIAGPLLTKKIASGAKNQNIASPLRKLLARMDSFSSRMNLTESWLRGHLWPALAVILGASICLHGGRIGNRQWMNSTFSPERFPVQATNRIAARQIHDPIFCPDYWGGYLIYRLYPQTRVVMDDRHDLYGENFVRQYLQVIHVAPRWSEVLDRQHVDWVLTPTQSSLANVLKLSPHWVMDYEDSTASLFRRMR
ncbi:MAG: hypothetical protein ACRD2U_14620 [Terriglobales bacterium]